MSSPLSGTSSGSISIQNSGSDENLQHVTDQRKRKRMISNRESARRSRMRKQKHLDEVMAQVTQLRAENTHMHTNMNVVTRLYLNVESENSVLRAQISELNYRLQALSDIIMINSMNSNKMISGASTYDMVEDYGGLNQMISGVNHDFLNPFSLINVNQPIMASPDAFMMY